MGRLCLCLAMLCMFVLPGCKPAQPIVPDTLLPEPITDGAPLPDYRELVQRYNATVEPFKYAPGFARL